MPRRKRETPYRLRREARKLAGTLSKLTEKKAYDFVKSIRWETNGGEPWCPECGSTRVYAIRHPAKYWKCGEPGCRKKFSVTSGTIFHSRKLSYQNSSGSPGILSRG